MNDETTPNPRPTGWYIHEARDGSITFLPLGKAWAKWRREGGYVYHATQGYNLAEYDEHGRDAGSWVVCGTMAMCKERREAEPDYYGQPRFHIDLCPKRLAYIEDFVRFAQLSQGLQHESGVEV
jgi:hypothetical protein